MFFSLRNVVGDPFLETKLELRVMENVRLISLIILGGEAGCFFSSGCHLGQVLGVDVGLNVRDGVIL